MIRIQKLKCEFPQFKDLVDAYIPSYVIIPLKDADGTLCNSRKTENTRVSEGEIIAQASASSPAIHATVPGFITDFKMVSIPNGKKTKAAIIRTDGSFSYLGRKAVKVDWKKYSPADIFSVLSEKGVPDTFDKTRSLSCSLRKYIEKSGLDKDSAVAVRLFDSDPTVKTGEFLTDRKIGHIIEGAAIVARSLSINKIVFIASHDIDTIKKATEDYLSGNSSLEIDVFKAQTDVYPSGGYREIKLLLRKNKYSCTAFFAVDAETALFAFEAVALNKPVLEKYVQFSGTPLTSERMFRVRIGTSIRKLVEECGGFKQSVYKIVTNGLIKGTAVSDLDMPVTADLKSVTFLPKTIIPFQKQVNCIRCGSCHRACPKNIHPDKLFSYYYFHTEINDKIIAMASECTRCGVCDTACPARLPLSQTIALLQGGKE